ncbi:phosphopantothenoylcysteine decarboxylase [Mucilaginibacter sp. P25]
MKTTHNKPIVLITAGPTREAIDPVRFISNHLVGQNGLCHCRGFFRSGL